jgi:hypothetical protein
VQTSIDTQAWFIGMTGLALVVSNPREAYALAEHNARNAYAFVRSFFTTRRAA